MGAVVLDDTSTLANALATVYLTGTGQGPQVAIGPARHSVLRSAPSAELRRAFRNCV
jgi:hypothetical protein